MGGMDTHDRFFSHVDQSGDCWLWTAGTFGQMKYGRFWDGTFQRGNPKSVAAHRWSYEFHVGPIPEGKFILHRCDVPLCVKPDHLFLGDHADNMADMVAKGRWKHNGLRGEKSPTSKLSDEEVAAIREMVANGATRKIAAEKYGVTPQYVGLLVRGIYR